MYTQFQGQAGISATFPTKKYVVKGDNAERAQFDADLQQFKEINKTRKDHKKSYEPTLDETTESQLHSLREDENLFSHEKMVQGILI